MIFDLINIVILVKNLIEINFPFSKITCQELQSHEFSKEVKHLKIQIVVTASKFVDLNSFKSTKHLEINTFSTFIQPFSRIEICKGDIINQNIFITNLIYRICSFCSPGPYFFQPNSLPDPYSNGPLFEHGRLLFSK